MNNLDNLHENNIDVFVQFFHEAKTIAIHYK